MESTGGRAEFGRWVAEIERAQAHQQRAAVQASGLDEVLRDLDSMWRARQDVTESLAVRDLADRLAAGLARLVEHDGLSIALLERFRAMEIDIRAADERWFTSP